MKENIMSANTETCANNDKSYCDYNEFRRLKYFHGMLLDEKDFRAEQQYHTGKRRFLNRMLHGSGVVCGLELDGEKGKSWIKITPGLAFDCSGNEIWVEKDLQIDLASLLPPKDKGKAKGECRPEDEKDGLRTYYIGICYQEKPTTPVSVYLPSGGCEERSCENSQWKEGYCVQLVDCCPEKLNPGVLVEWCKCKGSTPPKGKYKDLCGKCNKPPEPADPKQPGQTVENEAYCRCLVVENFCESSVPCPECGSCDESCFVILGQIKIDKDKVVLEKLCMNECRRYVLTGRMVQQILVRMLSGASGLFNMRLGDKKEKLPENLEEFIYNPFKALCWWLPFKLQGGQFEWLNCEETKQVADDPKAIMAAVMNVNATSAAVRLQLDNLEKESQSLKERIQKLGIDKTDVSEAPGKAKVTEAEPAKAEVADTEPLDKSKVVESEPPADKQSPKQQKKG
jgi:hypothetical protein